MYGHHLYTDQPGKVSACHGCRAVHLQARDALEDARYSGLHVEAAIVMDSPDRRCPADSPRGGTRGGPCPRWRPPPSAPGVSLVGFLRVYA